MYTEKGFPAHFDYYWLIRPWELCLFWSLLPLQNHVIQPVCNHFQIQITVQKSRDKHMWLGLTLLSWMWPALLSTLSKCSDPPVRFFGSLVQRKDVWLPGALWGPMPCSSRWFWRVRIPGFTLHPHRFARILWVTNPAPARMTAVNIS